jgi:hypothetical protein
MVSSIDELPLVDELVPFLMARSGQALDEFARWVAPRRPPERVLTMIEHMPMSLPTREELLRHFGKADDPEVLERRQQIIKVLLEADPQTRQELIDQGLVEGRLLEARDSLRQVLVLRKLTPSQSEDARIAACTDLATLKRWLERSVTATSVVDALE